MWGWADTPVAACPLTLERILSNVTVAGNMGGAAHFLAGSYRSMNSSCNWLTRTLARSTATQARLVAEHGFPSAYVPVLPCHGHDMG